ncbi:MAG: hypothetical protein V7K39_17130 [Nostoc sp.]
MSGESHFFTQDLELAQRPVTANGTVLPPAPYLLSNPSQDPQIVLLNLEYG